MGRAGGVGGTARMARKGPTGSRPGSSVGRRAGGELWERTVWPAWPGRGKQELNEGASATWA